MLEDIKQRLALIHDYQDMNPYQLWFDAKYLLSEVEYWKARCLENEKILDDIEHYNWCALSIADRDKLIKEAMK